MSVVWNSDGRALIRSDELCFFSAYRIWGQNGAMTATALVSALTVVVVIVLLRFSY